MSKKQKQKHNENMTDNIEEIDLANHEAENSLQYLIRHLEEIMKKK